MSLTVSEIRKQRPRPRRAIDGSGYADDDYCVGGALCLSVGIDQHYPSDPHQILSAVSKATDEHVTSYLMSDKNWQAFLNLAQKMIDANDAGKFSLAWKILERLFCWKCDKVRP